MTKTDWRVSVKPKISRAMLLTDHELVIKLIHGARLSQEVMKYF